MSNTSDSGKSAGQEPSMDEILASIRRVLNEDEAVPQNPSSLAGAAQAQSAFEPGQSASPPSGGSDDIFLLDQSMMVNPNNQTATHAPSEPTGGGSTPMAGTGPLIAPEAAAAATSSVGQLVRKLSAERSTPVSRSGPTIEDLVREEIRPVLKNWLDSHLPPLVERLVRIEIERVVNRAVADN